VSAKVILYPMRRRWILNSAPPSVLVESPFQPAPLGSNE
jgi:OFA family oxalate/formate antiporter-like MFS transporter